MAKYKTTVRFWLRTDRPNKDGTSPVHLVYQIQGQRKYYGIPEIKLLPCNWHLKDQQAMLADKKFVKEKLAKDQHEFLLTGNQVTEINNKLAKIQTDVKDVETRFRLDQVTYSPQMVIDRLKELKQPETRKDLPGTFVVDFIKRFEEDSIGTHKPGTLKVYYGLRSHIEEFEKAKKHKWTFENIDVPAIRAFYGFLTEGNRYHLKTGEKMDNMNNVTAAKQISTLKTLLNYARSIYKIKVNQDYRDYKVSRKDTEFEVITLTQDEFMSVYNLDLTDNKRLEAVRDVFCFSCATGLRYSDLAQLRREHIRKDNTIRMTASKTGQKLVIPLNPISHAILQKYTGRHLPLPIISNQKTNDYLKEIGKKAEIDTPIEKVRMYGVKKVTEVFKKYELLSIHVGRKSFITLSLEKGIAIQEVMSLSGHTTFKAFRRYVDINDSRKKTVMADAWGKVKDDKLKAV